MAINPFLIGVFNKIYRGDLKRELRRMVSKHLISSRLRSVFFPSPQQNARRARRVSVHVKGSIRVHEKKALKCTVFNISETGVFIKLDTPVEIKPGETLSLTAPGLSLSEDCVAVWRDQNKLGLQLVFSQEP